MDKIKNEVTEEVKGLTKEDYLSILEFLKNHAGEEYSNPENEDLELLEIYLKKRA